VTIESSHYGLEGTEAKFWLVVVGLVAKTLKTQKHFRLSR